jgi:hypothetical protein
MEVRSVETIVRALNAAQVQYLIVGGLAACRIWPILKSCAN